MLDKDEAERLSDQLAALPHYHVVGQLRDDEVNYSDVFTWPGAVGFAADLIAPPAGAPQPGPGLEALWIVEGDPVWCPLAHGDGAEYDEQTAAEFLEQAMQQQPYWSAPLP
jgi:hypothetical protein